MTHFDYLLDMPLRARRQRLLRGTTASSLTSTSSEWDPVPLGRLGRLLWTDIDRYLEFVAIVRTEPPSSEPPRPHGRAYDRPLGYLWLG